MSLLLPARSVVEKVVQQPQQQLQIRNVDPGGDDDGVLVVGGSTLINSRFIQTSVQEGQTAHVWLPNAGSGMASSNLNSHYSILEHVRGSLIGSFGGKFQ